METKNLYIGWDVGAWKCSDGKDDSCDSLVMLDDNGIIGHYRKNFSSILQYLKDQKSKDDLTNIFVSKCLELCGINNCKDKLKEYQKYYLAIDTPLGWSKDFTTLLSGDLPENWNYNNQLKNNSNTLLFRYTEREKLKVGMSVIVDSIGSQSVKGLMLLRILGAKDSDWGVWKSHNLTIIETYPKACLVRKSFVDWMAGLKLNQIEIAQNFRVLISSKPNKYKTIKVIAEDSFDAVVCACVSKAFALKDPKLVIPNLKEDPKEYKSEGWIFYPETKESPNQKIADNHKSETCAEGVKTFDEAIAAFKKFIKGKLKGNQ